MRLCQRLIEFLAPQGAARIVQEVRIGLGYTAVRLDDGSIGVAYTLGRDSFHGCSAFIGIRPLAGRPVADLLPLLCSDSLIEASVGLATANALANHPRPGAVQGDVVKVLNLLSSDTVTMIGFFGPLLDALDGRVARIEVFDERREVVLGLKPSRQALTVLGNSDVALITSTSIINRTIDELLDAASRCREVVMLGPSTPLATEVFEETPVTWLSGVTVADPDGLMQVVSEAGGTRVFSRFVTKCNIPVGHRPRHSAVK